MKNSKYSKLKRGIISLLLVCIISVIILFVLGHFIELHPNAYRDMIRSIFIGTGIFLGVYYVFAFLKKQNESKGLIDSFSKWWEDKTPLEAICESFTIITFINSIMMIIGYDTPKEGVFAYVHMMMRLGIITMIISLIMWEDVLGILWNKRLKNNLKEFFENLYKNIFKFISVFFTVIVTIYCSLIIIFQRIFNPTGGIGFYQLLLFILLLLTVAFYIKKEFK